METFITIYNSITGSAHTFPINQEEILWAQQSHLSKASVGELVSLVYHSSCDGNTTLEYTSALCYTIQSKTFKGGSSMGMNSYYLYLSRGNGDGFIGMCGSSKVKDIKEAAEGANIHFEAMVPTYVEYQKKNNTGSNFTKPKKKRK